MRKLHIPRIGWVSAAAASGVFLIPALASAANAPDYSTDIEEVQSIEVNEDAVTTHRLEDADGLYNFMVLVDSDDIAGRSAVQLTVRDGNNRPVLSLTPEQPVVLAHLEEGSYRLSVISGGISQDTSLHITGDSLAAVKIDPELLPQNFSNSLNNQPENGGSHV